ncbi:hypothetical protein ACTXT7_004846 [Hymenolepis weldensis]
MTLHLISEAIAVSSISLVKLYAVFFKKISGNVFNNFDQSIHRLFHNDGHSATSEHVDAEKLPLSGCEEIDETNKGRAF